MITDPCQAERDALQQAQEAMDAAAQAAEKYDAAKPLSGDPHPLPPEETDDMIYAYARLEAAKKTFYDKLWALRECTNKHPVDGGNSTHLSTS